MSTIRTLVLSALFCPMLMYSQNIFIGGGVNGYFISNPVNDGSSFMRRGYQIGADVMVGNIFYARGGIYFTGTETNLEFDDGEGAMVSGAISATHIRIPLQGGIRVYEKDHLSVFIQSGPSGMISLSYDQSDVIDILNDSDYRSLQWGWTFGGGLRVNFMEFSVSYDSGLSRTYGGSNSNRSRFGLLQLTVGFTI